LRDAIEKIIEQKSDIKYWGMQLKG
jgi:hypothetical protein